MTCARSCAARYSTWIIAKIHHAESLEALWPELKQRDDIDVIFLPPYSPFLNPIEYAFNKMKLLVKETAPQTRNALRVTIIASAERITAADAAGFFRKSKSYWEQVQLGMPFLGTLLEPLVTPPPLGDVYNEDEVTDEEAH
jgi:hypothetical protein